MALLDAKAPSHPGLRHHCCITTPPENDFVTLGLTVMLHGAAVHAAAQAWLLAVGGSPAGVAVAVLVAVADLQGEKEGWRPPGTRGN